MKHVIFHHIMLFFFAYASQNILNPCNMDLGQTQLVDEIQQSMNDRQQTYLIFIDFFKAFDMVPHKRLLNKLNFYGI